MGHAINAWSVLEMGSFVHVVSSAVLMQKYEIGLYLLTAVRAVQTHCCTQFCDNCDFLRLILFVSASQACSVHVVKWYELHGIVDTRDTCAVSQYFVRIRYTAVYRDLGDTGIVT